MNNGATIKINVDEAIMSALREDVTRGHYHKRGHA